MIWNSIKNYLKSFKYILTPIGGLALFAIIGFGIAFAGCKSAIGELFVTVQNIFPSIEVNTDAGIDILSGALLGMDWNDPQTAASMLTNPEFLGNTLAEAISAMVGQEVGQNVTDAVILCIGKIVVNVVIFFIFALIGIIVGYIFLRIGMRSEFAKRKIWQTLIAVTLETLFGVLIIFVGTRLAEIWIWNLLFVTLFAVISLSYFGLIEGFFFHAKGKLLFKDVVSVKCIIGQLVATLIIYTFTAGLITLIYFAFGGLVALLLGISIFEIAYVVVTINSESYVRNLVQKTKIKNEK